MMRHAFAPCLALAVLSFLPFRSEEHRAPYAEVIDTIVRAEREGKWEEALAGATLLLDEADARRLTEYQRAELHFASGVVLADRWDVEDPDELREALPPFRSARALAGPGDLRLDAGYDLGVTELLRAERYRARIPELGGQPPAPATPPANDDEEQKEEDPLETARKGYRAAKEFLLTRLRSDWRDEDTRANLELIQRRLRELDEIERQREEQEQQSEQEQSENDQDQPQDGEPQEDEGEPEDREGEEQEGEGENEGEQETDPLETNAAEEEAPPEAAPPVPTEERNLTKEEAVRLLDILAELEKQGVELERALKQARREPVKRDW